MAAKTIRKDNFFFLQEYVNVWTVCPQGKWSTKWMKCHWLIHYKKNDMKHVKLNWRHFRFCRSANPQATSYSPLKLKWPKRRLLLFRFLTHIISVVASLYSVRPGRWRIVCGTCHADVMGKYIGDSTAWTELQMAVHIFRMRMESKQQSIHGEQDKGHWERQRSDLASTKNTFSILRVCYVLHTAAEVTECVCLV